MAIDEAKAKRLNNALVSVYHYGRQETLGRPVEVRILPLEQAVDDLLIDPPDPAARRSIILALLDLCRTRMAPTDSLVDKNVVQEQVIRLARAIGPLVG